MKNIEINGRRTNKKKIIHTFSETVENRKCN